MKIGLVCPYNIARGGGVQEIVRDLRVEFGRRGHEAKIITPLPRDIEDRHMEGVVFVGNATDFRSPLHTTAQLSMSVDIPGIDEMLERENFDILHFHEPWVPMINRQILSRSRTVNVATFHAKIPETMMSRTVARVVTPYTKSITKYLDELTAVSEAAAEWVSSTTDQPVRIIPNGIDLSQYKELPEPKPLKGKTILYVGRLERRKGVKYLIDAFALLQQFRPEVHLIIAGDGSDRAKLEQQVKELGLKKVHFKGFVTDAEKKRLLASADLFCSPAIFGESFGIVLLEAMAAGVVTVAGDNSGYASVMTDLGAISLVNPHVAHDFARRLDIMLYQEDLRKIWRKWAAEHVKTYTYKEVADMYLRVYEDAIKKHKTKK